MIFIYPGSGLGGTYRPRLAGTMGYAPIGSVLPPVGEIISAEPTGEIISNVPDDLTSDEIDDVISSLEELLLVSAEPLDVVSKEIFDPVVSIEPSAKYGYVYSVPISDDIVIGPWVDTEGNNDGVFWNDVTDDDDTWITAELTQANGSSAIVFSLSTVEDPKVNFGHVLRIRLRGSVASLIPFDGWANFGLATSSNLVISINPVRGKVDEWTEHAYPLTEAQAALITDYSDLQVLVSTGIRLNQLDDYPIDIAWIKLEVPDMGTYITSEEPSDIISDEPTDGIESEEPT
jgi:hypothetical protein